MQFNILNGHVIQFGTVLTLVMHVLAVECHPSKLQISQFLNYSWSLRQKLGGDDKVKAYLSRSLYVTRTDGNDIGLNYLANITFQNTTSVEEFIKLMISKYNEYLVLRTKLLHFYFTCCIIL